MHQIQVLKHRTLVHIVCVESYVTHIQGEHKQGGARLKGALEIE